MRRFLLAVAVLSGGFLAGGLKSQATADDPVSHSSVVTDDKQANYIDDDDQRSLADLLFEPHPENPHALQLTISALGPNVEPIAGFRGIRGSNRYTAEELELILQRKHRTRVVTTYDSGLTFNGRLREGRRGYLPERRLTADGSIDFLGQSVDELPLDLVVETDAESSGRRTTLIYVNRQPRLRCSYDIKNGRVVDLEVQSLGNDGSLFAGLPSRKQKFRTASLREPECPIDVKLWQERDTEGRWVVMQRDLVEHPDHNKPWVEWLTAEKDYPMLEWLALYQPDAFKSWGVGKALFDADADQWLRVAAWHTKGPPSFGHGQQSALAMLIESKPDVAEDWLYRHSKAIDNWNQGINQHFQRLIKDKIDPVDASRFSPPFKPADVFVNLVPPEKVVDFGDRKKAEPGVVYTHQVRRAINGVIVSGRRQPELLKQIRSLVKHSDDKVRQEALLAYSYVSLSIPPDQRYDDLLKIVNDPNEPDNIRESALMGYSYMGDRTIVHPQVQLTLYSIASDSKHPAWKAAVSRLGDLSTEFSWQTLKGIKKQDLSPEQAEILTQAQQMKGKLVKNSRWNGPANLQYDVWMTVHAASTNHPATEELRKMTPEIVKRYDDKSRTKLATNRYLKNKFWTHLPTEEFDDLYEAEYSRVLGERK